MGGQYTSLKGVANYGDPLVSDLLEDGLISFLQWGLLGVGAFTNVALGASGVWGGDPSRLRPVSDPRYQDGQVWEGFRQDWVWESGVEYGTQPVAVSGVWVAGGFVPAAATGAYAHSVDYPRGRVLFAEPVPVTGVVIQCAYSYRSVRLTRSDAPWWQELQFDSLRGDDPTFLQPGSGAWHVLADNRVQLPAVVVEPVMNVRLGLRDGLEVGSSARVHHQDVLCHVLAETPFDRGQLHDLLVEQWQKRFFLVDKAALLAADAFPLNASGYPVPGALMYPQLVAPTGEGGFRGRLCEFLEVRSQEALATPPLYGATVRVTLEVDLP